MTLTDLPALTQMPFHGVLMPTVMFAPEVMGEALGTAMTEPLSNLAFLRQLCRQGFRAKSVAGLIPKDQFKEYGDRVNLELDVIEALGFTNYILMVWDICRFADVQKIPRGPGRGSVSSSLVCHLIDLTEADPIKTGLFFTRFLSKARAKVTVVDGISYVDGSLAPDVDMDFSYYRRAEIVTYLNERYKGQTSKLLTTTTFTSKILIKDVLKTFEGANEGQANDASDLIEKEHGIPQELDDALHGNQKWRDGDEDNGLPPNQRFTEWSADHKETCEIALKLSGLNRGEGMHASALAICAHDIDRLIPLQLSGEKETVSGFDMYSAQEIVLKFDLLGLKTLDVIQETCDKIGIKPRDIDIHHESVYRYLQDFQHRYGIFQLETFAQGGAAAKIRPMNFEQLTACLAIARPGAFAYLDQYVKYLHENIYQSIHPLVDDILKPTGGVCVYQEQYLAMLIRVGMTPDEAEAARKVLGKKLKDKVPKVIANIEAVCKRNDHPQEIVDVLVKIAYDSGGYQFALAHATAYAMLTARTLWLKANHPREFYWALLRMTRNESDGQAIIATVEQEMRSHGFQLLPPHLLHSDLDFKLEGKTGVRFGLGMIRGVSDKSMEKLDTFRGAAGQTQNKFEAFQACKNAGLNIGIGSALIQAGCMDGFDRYVGKDGKSYQSRSRLVLELHTWNLLTGVNEKSHCLTVGARPEVNWDVLLAVKYLTEVAKNEKGKPLIKPSRFETIKKHYQPFKEIYGMNSRNERLACFWYERHVLGYSYSETLRGIFGDYVDGLQLVKEARTLSVNSLCRLIGFVSAKKGEEPQKSKTKAGNSQFKFVLTDETGQITVKTFNEKIDKVIEQNGRLPEEGDIVVLNAKKMDGDTLFLERGPDGSLLGIQTSKIYLRLSELKDAKTKETSVTP